MKGTQYGYGLNDSYPDLFTTKADQCKEIIFSIMAVNGTNSEYGMAYPLRLGTRCTYGGGWNNNVATDYLADMYENRDGSKFSWEDYFPVSLQIVKCSMIYFGQNCLVIIKQ